MAELCCRLDGLPLAVELVAAHAATMAPADMMRGLEARDDLLVGGPRDRPARQQTLRATIAWSHDNLSADDQEVFAQLAVFAGAALIDDVVAICNGENHEAAQIIATLERLAAANLIRQHQDPFGNSRVSMLQVIREFAFDQLAASAGPAALQRRHANRYLALAEELAEQLHGSGQAEAFKRLRAEDAELTRALSWAASDHGDTDVGLRLIGSLWHYWEVTGDVTGPRQAARRVFDEATDIPERLRAPALSGLATLCWLQGDIDEAARLHDEALLAYHTINDPSGVAWSQMCLATQAVLHSDFDEATRLARLR